MIQSHISYFEAFLIVTVFQGPVAIKDFLDVGFQFCVAQSDFDCTEMGDLEPYT
jgi:hypothetical protein